MTRNVAQMGSARRGTRLRLWLAAMALLLGAAPAFAGARGQADFIGYSDDGRYFAFEQYGILDGSGGTYSDIFVTDLVKDKWMDGVPFSARTNGEDPAQNLGDTRASARGAAAPLLKKLGIENPVSIAALRGDGELGGDDKAMRFGHPFYSGIEDDFTMKLEVSDAPASPPGQDLAEIARLPARLFPLWRRLPTREPRRPRRPDLGLYDGL
jgi:hypothetical protein